MSDPEPDDDSQAEVPRGLLRSLWAHPSDGPERLMLAAVTRLGEPSWRFAERARQAHPQATPSQLTAGVRDQAVRITGIDGAISGCPFLIALVPAYVAALWEQARMGLRIAALNHRDPRDPAIVPELLWLRGVHPSLEDAQAAVAAARGRSAEEKRARLGLRGWYELGRRFLVLAGFLAPSEPGATDPPRWRQAASLLGVTAVWALTWIVPVTFMLLMGFSCVTSTRMLAERALSHYSHDSERAPREPSPRAPESRRTRLLRGAAIAVSVGIPLVLLGVSAQSRPAGIHWYYVLAGLLGLSLVLALAAVSARRGAKP
jgi:hypothetical protein